MHNGAMFNAYPDSLGKNLADTVKFLTSEAVKGAFRSFYILPTVFNTDLDGGFSVISYDLCQSLAEGADLEALRDAGIDLTFDFILNHLSVLSPQFRDILKNGDQSPYRDFFIDWNKFWEGRGEMTPEGYIRPDPDQFNYGNLRKNGLPILMIRLPDGREAPYWNTFYQKIVYPRVTLFDMMDLAGGRYDRAVSLADTLNRLLDEGKTPAAIEAEVSCPVAAYLEANRRYMGQMDINYQSPLVWEWYESVIKTLAGYGAATIRLDAFSRVHKAPGRTNFVNTPETWDILTRLKEMAKKYGVEVLPEIHASYSKGYYKALNGLGCVTYDYFLPGLILDALDTGDSDYLVSWAREIVRDGLKVVNMLGCHDGIPMRDVRGLLPDDRVDAMIERLTARGCHKKIVHGVKDEIYQIDTTYYTALGCDDDRLSLARAIQLFMPGKPQVWYTDLLAEASDETVFERDPSADTREVNRRRCTPEEARACLEKPVVKKQLELLKMRNTHPAFADDAVVTAEKPAPGKLTLTWTSGGASASLTADLKTCAYEIRLS